MVVGAIGSYGLPAAAVADADTELFVASRLEDPREIVVPTVTMLFGRVGAGKTTIARRMESENRAVRLSLDEWTIAATGDRFHADPQVGDRVTDRLMALWPSIVRAGASVVLDFGFWTRDRRDQVRELASECGAHVELIWVQCSDDERRRRCAARSPDDDAYFIDEDAFAWIESNRSIQEPTHDEGAAIIDTTP